MKRFAQIRWVDWILWMILIWLVFGLVNGVICLFWLIWE